MKLKFFLTSFVVLLLFSNKASSQNFFDSEFSSEKNYNSNTVKKKRIKALQIREYKPEYNKSIDEALRGDHYLHELEFDKNGNILKNAQYIVVDSIKELRYKDIFKYNKKNQIIREEYYDFNDSLLKIITYNYFSDRLVSLIEANNSQDTLKQFIYEYDKNNHLQYIIKHYNKENYHTIDKYEIKPKSSVKVLTYILEDPKTVKVDNDLMFSKLEIAGYSTSSFDENGKANTTCYDRKDNVISENLFYMQDDLTIEDRIHYDEDGKIKYRNKYVTDKDDKIIEMYSLVYYTVVGKGSSSRLEKTVYEYDRDFNVVKSKNDNNKQSMYKIEKDKKKNWILIQEYITDKKFSTLNLLINIYTRTIIYY